MTRSSETRLGDSIYSKKLHFQPYSNKASFNMCLMYCFCGFCLELRIIVYYLQQIQFCSKSVSNDYGCG